MNSKKFAMTIEAIVKEKKIPYMDAVLKFCEENDVDTATVGPLINKQLKEKIQLEAEKLNLIEKSSTATLPLCPVMTPINYILLLSCILLPLIMTILSTTPR